MRFLPLLLLFCGLCCFYGYYWHVYGWSRAGFSDLTQIRHAVLLWKEGHPCFSLLIFIGIYLTITACAIPLGTLLTVTGSVLFGIIPGIFAATLGATIGSILLFLATKTAFGSFLAKKNATRLSPLKYKLLQYPFTYLLLLRLTPMVPAWLINITAGTCPIRLRTFALATLLGVLPVTAIFCTLGNALILNNHPSLAIILPTTFVFALLTCLPWVYNRTT